MVLVLPARPNDGRDDTRGQLADLIECDHGAGRLLACSLFALGERGPQQVYVHSKIGIVDDRWLTIGSANLNEHSLFNDTEANVVTCDANLARETRLRLWSEHLQASARGDLRAAHAGRRRALEADRRGAGATP
jgi:phosphatidylserine/phosphatidylglycerophosphate/cardiolipin synthase-like enzyme